MPRVTLTPATVIARAADLADARGDADVSLSETARALDVQTPSLYTHVRDVEALRDGIAALALTELAARIAAAIAGRAGRDALAAFADAHREYARTRPGRWDALQRPTGDAVAAVPGAREIGELNAAVLRGYAVPADQHVHAVRLLGSTLNGFLTLERAGSFRHSSPDADASWPRIVDALDALLRAWPADPADTPPTTTDLETSR
jgi:AcrR family transcriptional regulator